MKQPLLSWFITVILSLLLLTPEVAAFASRTSSATVSAAQRKEGEVFTVARATQKTKKKTSKKKGAKKLQKQTGKRDKETPGPLSNNTGSRDCSSITCLVQSSKQCQPVHATLDTIERGEKASPFTITTSIEVQGKTTDGNHCMVSYHLTRFTGPYDPSLQNLIGTEGTCLAGFTETGMIFDLESLRRELEDPHSFGILPFLVSTGITNRSMTQCTGSLFENLRATSGG
ncbi:hypothetical protein HY285_01735 [Candidatus Peregrinibacteria bacterium]|nr:hypothetical protein [Candidatus Peregrinibacteria bacterium]MBI3816248.1 hypothetical protein [Candidatus Peregrinibacteria bacterium]